MAICRRAAGIPKVSATATVTAKATATATTTAAAATATATLQYLALVNYTLVNRTVSRFPIHFNQELSNK